MNYWEAFLLSFIEGLTEFLPISSTGHLILTQAFLGKGNDIFFTQFNVIIQIGAIFSVLVLYWRRFLPDVPFYRKLIAAFLPAAVLGLLVKDHIDRLLQSVFTVAVALILGGLVLIWTDKKFGQKPTSDIETLTLKQCFQLGLIQCLAFIPGVSRSGATILGGMWLGLSRKQAAEFSFFLGVLTLSAASVLKGYKIVPELPSEQISILLFGIVASFVIATLAIKFFLSLIGSFGFKYFGYYRVVLGSIILVMLYGELL